MERLKRYRKMRFKGRLGLEQGLKQIDIAPLVNIIFILFIFFILSWSLPLLPGIKVNLPKAITSEVVRGEDIEILLTAENVVYVNGTAISSGELKSLFKQIAGSKRAVLIKADRRASLGRAVQIWDLARGAGVSAINIATNQE